MDITTSWVKPPKAIGGLDHLAVQAPCINLYARMLPVITNVTDRARYYSFYPWVVWALEQRGHHYGNTFIDLFRKSDCLFTLIAERHAKVAGGERDDHAAATVGSGNMAAPVNGVRDGQSVRLSDVACREGEGRYFKNKLGGLGQYYIGVFRELGFMTGDAQSGIKNVREVGGAIAKAIDRHVNRDLFFKTIDEDVVSAERLDELHGFCPCVLSKSPEEHSMLLDMFFVGGQFFSQEELARRRTLQMLLSLADNLARCGVAIDIEQFRGCVYSSSLPDRTSWQPPERLQKSRQQWAIYVRNEILSLAVQGIFYVVLDSYHASGEKFHSVDELVRWFLEGPEVEQIGSFFPLNSLVAEIKSTANSWLPALEDWHNDNHEVQLASQIKARCGGDKSIENRATILLACLKILAALPSRPETRKGYGDYVFPQNYLQVYPINLQSFNHNSSNTWDQMTVREWIGWLASTWGINTHFMVALRKLRGQSQSTFRIRPSDQGLEIITVPEAVFTSPRFGQALRILKDVGALVRQGNVWVTSPLGKLWMEKADE
ncbi:MAG: hypothetical protein ACYC9M_07520 [Desulfobulbaceae bacterium]